MTGWTASGKSDFFPDNLVFVLLRMLRSVGCRLLLFPDSNDEAFKTLF